MGALLGVGEIFRDGFGGREGGIGAGGGEGKGRGKEEGEGKKRESKRGIETTGAGWTVKGDLISMASDHLVDLLVRGYTPCVSWGWWACWVLGKEAVLGFVDELEWLEIGWGGEGRRRAGKDGDEDKDRDGNGDCK